MTQQDLTIRVAEVLTALGVEYMITGSIASSLLGEPRATHDLDVVVVLPSAQVANLITRFPAPEYYLSESAIDDAIQHRAMFNLLHLQSGEKVDFWIVRDTEFDRARFARKQTRTLFGVEMTVCAAEDLILSKLHWGKLAGGSEKQFLDAKRVYEVQYACLDQAYLASWIDRLSIREEWQRLVAEAVVLKDDDGSQAAP